MRISRHARSDSGGTGAMFTNGASSDDFSRLCLLALASKMEHTIMDTSELKSIPNPCMENTPAINAPRVRLLANSAIIVADNG
ncbi:hypothetical protein HanXRQr2_Chr08g0327181 [Helianthus annuus]|uniref:Uncharacterized protein n=1 Tax=Helianthus annuus TaxID=4232 RepID=A0A9K3ID52_HELAN|nr:hypothetical protein HanXRQr2_Chr08g0327181 [Helianthus annuus]